EHSDTIIRALSQPQAGEPLGYLVQGFDGGPSFAPDRERYDRQGHAVIPVYASPQRALAVEGLHGTYGWLNGHRALSEASWTLESGPMESGEEEFATPLSALVGPFKEVGKGWDGRSALVASPPPSGEALPGTCVTDQRLDQMIGSSDPP